MSPLDVKLIVGVAVVLVGFGSCPPEGNDSQKLRTLQAAYEGRIAEMQRNFDDLNALLVLSEARFQNEIQKAEPRTGRRCQAADCRQR